MAQLSTEVTFYWGETKQTIDGFGVFAGRAEPFFSDENRDEILEALFGENGLKLSILRAEVLDSYSSEEGIIDFHTDADIDVRPGDPDFPAAGSDDITQRGQLWIMTYAKQEYGVSKIVASTWSPPVYMKTISGQEEGEGFNRLNPDYDEQFASYLAQFAVAMNSAGAPIWAVSPMNEPEYPTPSWPGTVWTPADAARFVSKLKSALQQMSPETKVMIGETANWQLADLFLADTLSKTDATNIDILASHGYSLPNISGTVTFNINPLSWEVTTSTSPRWITEISSTESFDPSMVTGMKLAISMHKYFATQALNAFIYWLGVVQSSNESLINSDTHQYSFTKLYDIMGQYSRYIQPGDVRIGVSSDEPTTGVYISAYRSSDANLSIVITNSNEADETLILIPDGISPSTLQPYVTTGEEGIRWQPATPVVSDSEGQFTVILPAQSVTTLIKLE
jgi:glucuronoarabinoxylan endo-1,4-beta-xylanase